MRRRKRVFIGLLGACVLLAAALALGLHYAGTARPEALSRSAVLASGILSGAVLLMGAGVLGVVLFAIDSEHFRALQGVVHLTIRLFYPAALLVGGLARLPRERVEASFIEINNLLVRVKELRVSPDKVMVLLPHCLQSTECVRKITLDPGNCRRCGGCVVGELLSLLDRLGVRAFVASGGGQARRFVESVSPEAIVAVACEHELASGIHDVRHVPVFAVPNRRPNGPCRDTTVDVAEVRRTVEHFTNREEVE